MNEKLQSLCPSNAAACSLPPHKVIKERVLGSLNGVYYRLVNRDTGNPIVIGIIGETRELARTNTLEAIRAENAIEHPTADAAARSHTQPPN